jgi:hypothetical protein
MATIPVVQTKTEFQSSTDLNYEDNLNGDITAGVQRQTFSNLSESVCFRAADESIGGSWSFTNVVSGVTPTENAHLATKSYVDSVVNNEFDYIDYNPALASDPAWTEGRVFYDKVNKCLAVYDDEADATLQVGQEVRVRVRSTEAITNGEVVTVTGLHTDGITVTVEKAIANDATSALNTIGIATHDMLINEFGWATTSGFVNGVNTTLLKNGAALTEGAAIYLSETVAGEYQETRPLSPSYEVRMGGVAKADATDGKLYAELRIITNTQDNNTFFNGAILEPNEVVITPSGGVVNCQLNSLATNSKLSLLIDQDYISVADGINIDLTLGTDTVPIENWVYINNLGAITKNTTAFPNDEQYTPIARVLVPSYATALATGVYKVHAYTDHLGGTSGQGHLSHINEWIRKRPAAWQSGCVLTPSSTDTAVTTLDLAIGQGNISQLHDHTYPAINTTTKPAFVINDSTTAYAEANGITSDNIPEDSEGVSLGNKYYNLVVWGVVSEETKDCQLFFNLPNASYTSLSDGVNDVDASADYTIPTEYLGTGFLMYKLVIKRTSTTVEFISDGLKDLRGSIPAVGGGSAIGGAGITTFTELSDTPIAMAGNGSRIVRVNSAGTALEYQEGSTALEFATDGKATFSDDVLGGLFRARTAATGITLTGGTSSVNGANLTLGASAEGGNVLLRNSTATLLAIDGATKKVTFSGSVGIGTTADSAYGLLIEDAGAALRIRNVNQNFRADFAVTAGGLSMNCYDDDAISPGVGAYIPITYSASEHKFEQGGISTTTGNFTGAVTGIDPTSAFHLSTKQYVDGAIVTDHGSLSGLGDDDHTQYALVDGTRAFTGVVGGVAPTIGFHFTTKDYVDGKVVTDHGGLAGLTDDDHAQYARVDGARNFTGAMTFESSVSGITPTADANLATKGYVDSAVATTSSGTYTPTLTGVTNIASSNSYKCMYSRVGDIVTVSGTFDTTSTLGSSTGTLLRMTLPISSTFTTNKEVAGTMTAVIGAGQQAGMVYAAIATNEFEFSWDALITGSTTHRFVLNYEVL